MNAPHPLLEPTKDSKNAKQPWLVDFKTNFQHRKKATSRFLEKFFYFFLGYVCFIPITLFIFLIVAFSASVSFLSQTIAHFL